MRDLQVLDGRFGVVLEGFQALVLQELVDEVRTGAAFRARRVVLLSGDGSSPFTSLRSSAILCALCVKEPATEVHRAAAE